MSSPGEERHDEGLHTDDDWKEQARREKERLAQELASEPSQEELPPASISGLVEELSWRALLCLGQVADPRTGEGFVDLPSARYVVELLEVLEKKTKGNLDKEEEHYLGDVVHNLRIAYVEVARKVEEHLERAGAGGKAGSRIMTPDDATAPGDEPDSPEPSGPRIIL